MTVKVIKNEYCEDRINYLNSTSQNKSQGRIIKKINLFCPNFILGWFAVKNRMMEHFAGDR